VEGIIAFVDGQRKKLRAFFILQSAEHADASHYRQG
jgi:hypothetical protein